MEFAVRGLGLSRLVATVQDGNATTTSGADANRPGSRGSGSRMVETERGQNERPSAELPKP